MLRFRLDQTPEGKGNLVARDGYVDDTRLSPQDIRVLAERKLSSRSCSLRRALLIQNALPHLGPETQDFDLHGSPEVPEEESGLDRVVSASFDGLGEDEFGGMDDEHDRARCPSPPEDDSPEAPSCQAAVELELDASYQAAMREFEEVTDSDLLLSDAEEAVASSGSTLDGEPCADLDVLASVGVACMERQNRVAASPSQARKRRDPDAEADDASLKCGKPARSSSPCRLSRRLSDAAEKLSCSRNMFTVLPCC